MKPLKNKITKNLIIIFIITAILSGTLPNYAQAATNTNSGGGLLAQIEKFCVFLCDEVMQWLQNTFTSPDSIEQPDGTYEFKYSPGIIFSGTVAAFDINFIKRYIKLMTIAGQSIVHKNNTIQIFTLFFVSCETT